MDLRSVAREIVERRKRGEIPVIIQTSSDQEANLSPTYYADSAELASDIIGRTPAEGIIGYGPSTITIFSFNGWLSYEILADSALEETLYLLTRSLVQDIDKL